ncbi:hypothetical protein [Pseudoramibacter sp.]|uniref:hypothetical protein n=1 Tax=Pseudoramibacter sp. TaxID=2034862 RepID=UPI0025F36D62|nr:hypothetical protein [Pseudoramibacter sp.]MCH4071779.1 hypothetical protein [Pseudoramibacter sp.]MCH4105547.1 hypothetical protein [Pseudoramibacter sp.]
MLDGRLPLWIVIGIGGNVNGDAFFRDALLSNMTGSACTNAILQLFSMSFMAVDLSFLKISIRRAVRSLYYFVSGAVE